MYDINSLKGNGSKTFTDAVQRIINQTKYSFDPVDPHPGRLMMKTRVQIKKWASEEDKLAGKEPFETRIDEGNLGLSGGITRALSLLTLSGTDGGLTWNTTLTCIGVGTSTTTASAADTGLVIAATSATAQEYHKMDATTYPAVSGSNMIVRSTFGSTEANFAWNEFVIKNATYTADSTSGRALIRKVSQQGTKISGQSWECTCTVTMS